LVSDTIEHRAPSGGKQTFLQHYGATVFGQGLTLALGILTGILSARMLGPAGRGEYAAVIVWPMGIAGFFAFGINQAVVFHIGQRTFSSSQTATAVTVIGILQSALSIAVGLVVVPMALAKYSATVQHLGIVFVLLTPAMIFSGYPASLFQGTQDFARFNLIRVLAPLTYALLLIGMFVTHHFNLEMVIDSQLGGYIVALAIGSVMAWRLLDLRMEWRSEVIPRLVHYGARTQALSVTYFFNQRIDQLLLSLLVPPRQLGLYAVAVTLSTSVSIFPQAAGIVAFSKGSAQHAESAKHTIGRAFQSSFIWLLISCSVLYWLAPLAIQWVFGETFGGSVTACRVLLPGAFAAGLSLVLYNAASALGRPGLASYAEGAGVFVTAAGLYELVPRFGFIGAAIVSSAAYITSLLVMLVLARRVLGIELRRLFSGAL